MSLLSWIILGLIAGFVASNVVNREGSGLMLDILLGIIGAVLGGWLFTLIGGTGATGVNLHSIVVAVIGAIAVLIGYHAIRRAV